MITDLPIDLLRASRSVLNVEPFTECLYCGMVQTCVHMREDALSGMEVPDEDAKPDELSGDQEEVVINPEYRPDAGRNGRTNF